MALVRPSRPPIPDPLIAACRDSVGQRRDLPYSTVLRHTGLDLEPEVPVLPRYLPRLSCLGDLVPWSIIGHRERPPIMEGVFSLYYRP